MNRKFLLCMLVILASLMSFSNTWAQDVPAGTAASTTPSSGEIIAIEAPNPKGATLKRDKAHKQVTLKQKSKTKNAITDEEAWFVKHQLKINELTYTESNHTISSTPSSYHQKTPIPELAKFNGTPLMDVFDNGDTQIYLYGTFYDTRMTLQIVKDGKVTHKMDFSSIAKTSEQYISWALVEDDILYVQHNGNGYAEDFKGQTAYISAISLKDNKILWTTKPLTSNAKNFIISGNSIITGYGFSMEPDFLYVIDKYSGTRVQTLKLKTGPEYIVEKDGLIYVRTYSEDYIFSKK